MTVTSSPKLYATLIIAIGVVAGYVVYSQWLAPNEPLIPAPAISSQDTLNTFKDLKIDFSVLDNPAYKALITSGDSPVNPGITGKKDLFAPIP